jgi:hypothetical protein
VLGIVEGSASSKTEKEIAGRAGAVNVEGPPPTILRERKIKKTTTLKELTKPYQDVAQNERT